MNLLKYFLLFLGFFLVSTVNAQLIGISENKRYLVTEEGEPFFWLGDTAWELFHRLNREEATLYLEDRAAKGFNVIQAVVLAELDGLNVPNPYGNTPLVNNDPLQPNEAYFEHVDFIVNKAASLNIVIGMLPTWGDKWQKKWGVGPVIFSTENAAEGFGVYMGKRYKNQENIIWILGGDRNPENEKEYAIIRAMAKGIEKGNEGTHLMTFHPRGGAKSSQFFHNDDWLDFNMFQSGHSEPDFPNYEMTTADYELEPVKPTLDGEPRYENIPIKFNIKNGRHPAYSIRRAAYGSLLAGACGHTYGNNNIWQMCAPERKGIIKARIPWYDAIKHPGAAQMGYARWLFESRAFHTLQPAQDILTYPDNDKSIRAAITAGGTSAIIYIPEGQAVKIETKKLKGESLAAWWFDPREGTAEIIGNFEKTDKDLGFIPPSKGVANDWVLILDNANAGLNEPGKPIMP
ncbi:MAG: glycoside hydrolase family 140 protein [Bacteroidota bacterium]